MSMKESTVRKPSIHIHTLQLVRDEYGGQSAETIKRTTMKESSANNVYV